MELIYNNESDLSEEHTQFLISSSKSLGDFSIEYSNTDLSEKNIIENEKNNSGVDYIFSSLFIGIPIAIAAITGAISGKAISRSGCCINCVANNIDSIIENYIFTNADYTFINQPYSNTDTIHYLRTIVPNIMRGITALTSIGLSIGSFWYDLEEQNSLYQHMIMLTSTAVITPVVFYITESYTSSSQDTVHYVGEGEINYI